MSDQESLDELKKIRILLELSVLASPAVIAEYKQRVLKEVDMTE